MPLPLQVALNSIASEAFRDQADRDYVHARAGWRLKLRDQFLWSGQQAIEKYLKGILLFDGRSARYIPAQSGTRREFGHSLTELHKAVISLPGYQINHPTWWEDYILRLEHYGQNRYLTRNARTQFDSLDKLDEAVWSVRRYCQHMRFDLELQDGSVVNALPAYMNTANAAVYKRFPNRLTLIGGQLETWLRTPAEPARAVLIWNNRFFGGRSRKRVRYAQWSSFVNAPVHRDWAQDPALRRRLRDYFKFD